MYLSSDDAKANEKKRNKTGIKGRQEPTPHRDASTLARANVDDDNPSMQRGSITIVATETNDVEREATTTGLHIKRDTPQIQYGYALRQDTTAAHGSTRTACDLSRRRFIENRRRKGHHRNGRTILKCRRWRLAVNSSGHIPCRSDVTHSITTYHVGEVK